jgi:hypothetical protein
MEQWKDVVGYEGRYQVSDLGNVRSLPNATRSGVRLLALNTFRNGYKYVNLYRGTSKKEKWLVHMLVAQAFIGSAPVGQEVRHRDGVRGNCALTNLCYGTRVENQADRIEHGTSNQGVRHPRARLVETQVLEIRNSNEIASTLAAKYSVSESLIHQIKRCQVWRHI